MSQDQIVSTYRTEADGACLQLSSVLVTPLDEQIGKMEKENVPADLLYPLFGMSATEKSAAGPHRQFITFVLLDAAKIPNLPELLSNSDVEHCCLFQGPNLGQLGNVSPWLAKIAKEDRLTRNFCTSSDAPWHF